MRPIIRASAAYHLPSRVAEHVALVAPLARFPTRRSHLSPLTSYLSPLTSFLLTHSLTSHRFPTRRVRPRVADMGNGPGARGQGVGARDQAGHATWRNQTSNCVDIEDGDCDDSTWLGVDWPADCGATCAGSYIGGR